MSIVADDTVTELDGRADALLVAHPPARTDSVTFLGAQFDAGLAYVHFPEGYGGLGLEPSRQAQVDARLQGAGAPSAFTRNPIGFGKGALPSSVQSEKGAATEMPNADRAGPLIVSLIR